MPIAREWFGVSLPICEMKKSYCGEDFCPKLLGNCTFEFLHLQEYQKPKPKGKIPLSLSPSNDSATMVRQEAIM